jgi:hypothetical protein
MQISSLFVNVIPLFGARRSMAGYVPMEKVSQNDEFSVSVNIDGK